MNCGSLHTQEYERLIDKEAENDSLNDGYVSVDALYQVTLNFDGRERSALSFLRVKI